MTIDDPEEEAFRDLDRRLNGLRSDDITWSDWKEKVREAHETFKHVDIDKALRNLNRPHDNNETPDNSSV
jgi:hypothetical protein